jgi:SAM-dependent methyltransferase
MSENAGVLYRRFPNYLGTAYTEVLEWLKTEPEARGFEDLQHEDISRLLADLTFLSCAGQFYDLFPAHYFKVVHALERVVGADVLSGWLAHAEQICVLDIGCGAGAASAAFIEAVLGPRERTNAEINVVCLAVDVNYYALAMYDRLMSRIGQHAAGYGVNVDYKLFREGIPASVTPMIEFLVQKRQERGQPSLAHLVVMQVNVVSPLGGDHHTRCDQANRLMEMGVSEDRIAMLTTQFGRTEALAYMQMLQAVPVDYLHVITISTRTRGYMLEARVRQMAEAVEQTFQAGAHPIERYWQGSCEVGFENPVGGYWQAKAGPTHSTAFYVDVTTAANRSIGRDQQWGAVVSIDNLRLAWARTRRGLLRQSVVDEVELRLFEHDLEGNLAGLQGQLRAYAADVARTEGRVAYLVPKGASVARIRGLSRIEEEILSAAIIQRLGHRLSALRGNSYAYRVAFADDDYVSEYLYEKWFDAYMLFRDEARAEAQRHEGCAVIQTDIRSFFNRIIRDRLVSMTGELLTQSDRVRWLLRLLFSKDIDRHEAGRGIVQGNIGSGFYANIYLTDVDASFGTNNRWGVRFFRYVDDMILVVPDPKDVGEVLGQLDAALKDLGLELHSEEDKKTHIYYDVSGFLEDTAPDVHLERLEADFEQVTNALWICCEDYRSMFRDAFWPGGEPWWYLLELYQSCLRTLGVFVSATALSRRLYRYVFNERNCRQELKRESELTFPSLPNKRSMGALTEWAELFRLDNPGWVDERDSLVSRLASLIGESWGEHRKDGSLDGASRGRLERRMRFGINRLAQLGFAEAVEQLVAVLTERPEIIREHGPVVQALAHQGFPAQVSELLGHYWCREDEIGEYMRAVLLRAIRYLPLIQMDTWKSLVHWATKGNGIDALAATETWLFVSDRCAQHVSERDVSAVESALCSDTQVDARLAKNYMLILGLYDSSEFDQPMLHAADLLASARRLATEDGVRRLTSYHEPEVLRRAYYSGQRPQRPEDEDDLDASL